MKVVLNIDENNYINSFYYSNDNGYEIDMSQYDIRHINCYQFIEGNIIKDEEKYNKAIEEDEEKAKRQEILDEVNELKKKLADTDYIWNVIKEGDATEEYYAEIIEQRHAWRERVRELENK